MSDTHQHNSQSSMDSNQPDNNGLKLNSIYVPVELIQQILSYADVKTLLNCQQVCKSWNEIIKDYNWRRKAEMKISCKISSKTILKWKDFYLIVVKNLFERNLIRNHSGEEGFSYWKISNCYFNTRNLYDEDSANNDMNIGNDVEIVLNSDDSDDEMVLISEFEDNRGWIVESPPIGVPSLPDAPEFENKQHCFVTTYYQCDKEYEIDLMKIGFSRKILDHLQPSIEVCVNEITKICFFPLKSCDTL